MAFPFPLFILAFCFRGTFSRQRPNKRSRNQINGMENHEMLSGCCSRQVFKAQSNSHDYFGLFLIAFSLSWMFEANRISIFWVLDAALCEKLLCAFQILMPVVRRTWRNHNGEESLGILGWRVEIKEQEKKGETQYLFFAYKTIY